MSSESGAEPKGLVTLPTGTVTFLFSDIEGSTQRWETHHEAMKDAVARHEQLMSAAIKLHGGYIFKVMGDAFCAAFPTAALAVGAALDAQRALAKENFSAVDGLRVRMGLHTGHAEERNADYFGPVVNRVARLMSIGHGGQVLVSEVSRGLARGDLPADTTLIDVGSHRLKDLTEPEHVWQLCIAGLPQHFPPLKSLDELPNNLPVQPTSFLGREHDLDEVKSLLEGHRMLTLMGAGGVGKTRLALQVGAELLDRFSDGVWFADISPITDPELVSSVVANALGMSQVQGRRLDEAIPQWLKRKQLLLIIDNCEHLLEAVAVLMDAIHRNAPNVRILATSRQALAIAGEAVHRLPSLAVPDLGLRLRTDEALVYGAIAVFVDRATLADTRFVFSDATVPIVADICRRLDGIPLAIELAAARVKLLSIPHLAQRLNERFKILTGGSRTALPRQKTLSALIDWSYDLLTAQEQRFFNRLGIFAGGFSLEAATAICAGDGLEATDILDLLGSLTDKSLVVAETGGAIERYRLLESTRAYALEKLGLMGEREMLARRDAEYFRHLAQRADERFGTGSRFAWLADAELELDNYRAALEWALTQDNDALVGGAIAGALGRFWFGGGLAVEGRYWIAPALERVSETEHPQIAARLWLALATLLSGKHMCQAAERAITLYASAGDHRGTARSQSRLAFGLFETGRLEDASEMSTRALAALRESHDDWGIAYCLNVQAAIEFTWGHVARGRDLYAHALAAFRALGDELGVALVLGNLAELEFGDGHTQEALRMASEGLEIDSHGNNTWNLALDHTNSAAYRIALGDLDGACKSAREGLRVARHAQDAQTVSVALQHIALLAALRGRVQNAAQLVGYVNAQFKELGLARQTTEVWGYEKLMAALREQLSEAEIERLSAEGAAWSEDQAVNGALNL